MAEDHHDSLSPPPPSHHAQEDPGAHEMDLESEDNFTDAQSQTRSRSHSRPESPIPITRVERVDHDAAYGEVPGTDAYEMRTEDARPDEIAFIPEDEDKLSSAPPSGAVSPGGHQIPKTVVEEVPASPVINSLSRRGTLSSHKRNPSDAMPDLVLQVEDTGDSFPVKSPHSETLSVPDYNSGVHEKNDDIPGSLANRATSFPSLEGPPDEAEPESQAEADNSKDTQQEDEAEEDDDGFGDFDDFEQGDEDAEFGDFDEADFQEAESTPRLAAAPVQSLPQEAAPLFPILDFSNLGQKCLPAATQPYLDALFPPDEIDTSTLPDAKPETPIFLTQRSASLWSQLVAAPPLQPPNWVRSRIRRLFLVSLGVPVDLDEILPASKQKKLVLPSTGLGSRRNSSDSRGAQGGSIQRLKDSEGSVSRTSVDSQGRPKSNRDSTSRRRGPPPEPQLDLVRGRQLCSMTKAAMDGLTMEELKEHVRVLEEMEIKAKEVLEYWTKRTDEKLGDREAFEGVIENLVQHARKVRK